MEDIINLKNKYNNLLKCTLLTHKMTLIQKVQADFMKNKLNAIHMNNMNINMNSMNINNINMNMNSINNNNNHPHIYSHNNNQNPNTSAKCIIYLHGLGSNRL